MALFKNSYKPGEMFQDKGVWFIAQDASYQNADDLEDGFDIFLPGSGVYTVAREATHEEIANHLAAIAYAQAHETDGFTIGVRVRRPGGTKLATVVAVHQEKRTVSILFDGKEQPIEAFAQFLQIVR